MTNGSNGSKGSGNTKLNPKRASSGKRWCFTWNNYKQSDIDLLINFFKNGSNKYIIGEEIGEDKKTPHLQGYVHFESRCRPLELKDLPKKIHWEKCKGTEEENINYCSKDGKYHTNLKVKKPLKILKEDQLYDWQKEIVDIVKTDPDDRSVYWFWEPNGNIGKTQLCKYICHNFGACIVEGKKNDILFCAAENDADCYIFDFERSMETFISYSAIEKIKNGFYMCSKYESKPIIRNSPHIICFANFQPDLAKLSSDRWKVKKITDFSKTNNPKSYAFIDDFRDCEEEEEDDRLSVSFS